MSGGEKSQEQTQSEVTHVHGRENIRRLSPDKTGCAFEHAYTLERALF